MPSRLLVSDTSGNGEMDEVDMKSVVAAIVETAKFACVVGDVLRSSLPSPEISTLLSVAEFKKFGAIVVA